MTSKMQAERVRTMRERTTRLDRAGDYWTEEEKEILTDACKIFVMKGQEVHLVEGEVFNIKITYPYDLRVAETLIKGEEK